MFIKLLKKSLQLSLFSIFFLSGLVANQTADSASLMELVYECENNPQGWPGLHWAIDKIQRPDVALEIIKLFPEEISLLTPSSAVWHSTGDWASERDFIYGYNPGYAATELAIKKEYAQVVLQLLQMGVDPNLKRMERQNWAPWVWTEWTQLGFAIETKNIKIIDILLSHGASLEEVYKQTSFRDTPARNFNAFMYSLQYFSENDVFKMLIEQSMKNKLKPAQEITGADIDILKKYTSDPTGTTGPWPALHHAFYVEDYEAAKRLFELGAHWDPYLYPIGSTWMNSDNVGRPQDLDEMAWLHEDSRFLNLLLEENVFAERVFLRAIAENRIDLVTKALELNIKSEQAILTALENENWGVFYLLVEQHYAISDEAVCYAFEYDQSQALIVLLEQGAKIPSIWLMESNLSTKPAILAVLLERGFAFDVSSLLNAAIQKDIMPVVKLVIEKCNVPNESVNEGIKLAIKLNRRLIYQYLTQFN